MKNFFLWRILSWIRASRRTRVFPNLASYVWKLIYEQGNRDANCGIDNSANAECKRTFTVSMRSRYTKENDTHKKCSVLLFYPHRKIYKRNEQNGQNQIAQQIIRNAINGRLKKQDSHPKDSSDYCRNFTSQRNLQAIVKIFLDAQYSGDRGIKRNAVCPYGINKKT